MPSPAPVIYEFDADWLVPTPTVVLDVFALTLLATCVLVWVRVARRRGARGPLPALAAALAALLVTEAALQAVARVAPRKTFAIPPGVVWRLNPNLHEADDRQPVLPANLKQSAKKTLAPNLPETLVQNPEGTTLVSSNSLGLREREIPLEKAPGEIRIVCVGDSWTFGSGVLASETFCRRLEERLNGARPGIRVTTVNCGMSGGTYLQGYLLLKDVGLKYQPDVILSCGFNLADAMTSLDDLDPSSAPFRAMLRRSMLYAVLRHCVTSAQAALGAEPHVMTRLDYAGRISDLATRRGIPIVFFDHAHMLTRGSDAPEIVRPVFPPLNDLPETPGRRVIALQPRLYRGAHLPFMQEKDLGHPSAQGHDEMARILADYLLREGLLRGHDSNGSPDR